MRPRALGRGLKKSTRWIAHPAQWLRGDEMKLLATIGKVVAALAVLCIVAFFAPRFVHDGPLGPVPGGPLRAGELFELPVSDWSFATDVAEIELQLESQRISRTTWILVRGGAAYVPCALAGKKWHLVAQQDGRAVLRIEGRRYPVTLTREDDPSLREFARAEVERKYARVPSAEGGVMFFKVTSRAASDR
jgi:hypothetical protein